MEALDGDCWSRNKSGCCGQPWAGRKSALQIQSFSVLRISASEPRSSCLHGKYLAGQLSYSWAVCGEQAPGACRSQSCPSLSGLWIAGSGHGLRARARGAGSRRLQITELPQPEWTGELCTWIWGRRLQSTWQECEFPHQEG